MRPWAPLVAVLLVATSAVGATALNRFNSAAVARLDHHSSPDDWQTDAQLDHQPALQDYEGEQDQEQEQEQDQDQGRKSITTRQQDAPPACGQTLALDGGATRIVNGENQIYGEFPSFVSLQDRFGHVVCGGTLISARHVLTAAHCLNGTGHLRALLGPRDPHHHSYNHSVAIRHVVCVPPDHVYLKSDTSDWAVLELEQEVDISQRYVRAACLPSGNAPRVRNEATNCWVVGAGLSDIYIYRGGVVVKVIPSQVQKLRVLQQGCSWEMNVTIHPSKFCYVALDPRHRGGICSGDSGGPVLCHDEDPPRWTLAAISNAHWGGNDCNKYLNRQITSTHTDVWSILDEMRRVCAWMGVP